MDYHLDPPEDHYPDILSDHEKLHQLCPCCGAVLTICEDWEDYFEKEEEVVDEYCGAMTERTYQCPYCEQHFVHNYEYAPFGTLDLGTFDNFIHGSNPPDLQFEYDDSSKEYKALGDWQFIRLGEEDLPKDVSCNFAGLARIPVVIRLEIPEININGDNEIAIPIDCLLPDRKLNEDSWPALCETVKAIREGIGIAQNYMINPYTHIDYLLDNNEYSQPEVVKEGWNWFWQAVKPYTRSLSIAQHDSEFLNILKTSEIFKIEEKTMQSQENRLKAELDLIYENCLNHPSIKYECQSNVFWQETADKREEDLTMTLCSEETYDQIIKSNEEFFLITIDEETNELSVSWVDRREFIFHWDDQRVGCELSSEQISDIQRELEDCFKGLTVEYDPNTVKSDTDWFDQEKDSIFWNTINRLNLD